MRFTVAAFALLIATSAFASPADDLVACMVGRAAVALHEQEKGNVAEALEIAYGGCGMEEADAAQEATYAEVADYINLMVERMAAE